MNARREHFRHFFVTISDCGYPRTVLRPPPACSSRRIRRFLTAVVALSVVATLAATPIAADPIDDAAVDDAPGSSDAP